MIRAFRPMKNPTPCHFFCVQIKIDHLPAGNEMPGVQGHRLPTRERLTMTVLIYVDTNKQVGDRDHLKSLRARSLLRHGCRNTTRKCVAFSTGVGSLRAKAAML